MSRGTLLLLTCWLALPAAMAAEDAAPLVAPGFNAVWSNGGGEAWAVGDRGVVAQTNDGGKSWHRLSAPTRARLLAVWRSPAGPLFVAGARGVILRRDPGGTWRRLRVHHKLLASLQSDQSPTGPQFRGVWGDDGNVYVVGGEPGAGAALCLLARLDATVLDAEFPCQVDDPVGVWGHGRDLFVKGRIYDCHSGDYSVLEHSSDGGRTWTRLEPAWAEVTAPYWLTDGGASYEMDAAGEVTRQQDGLHADRSTTQFRTGRQLDHRAIWADDQGEIYIVGGGYTILHSRDHGKSFGETKVAAPPATKGSR